MRGLGIGWAGPVDTGSAGWRGAGRKGPAEPRPTDPGVETARPGFS